MKDDIILINKPPGITSYDVIRKLKQKFPGEKLGHAGTLDPLAEGLLLVGIGKGTKKLKDLIGFPKTYEATVLIGKKTTTGDLEGDITEEKNVESLTEKEVRDVLEELTGIIRIPIPLYSAIKYKGKRLYKHAREGADIETPHGDMEVHSTTLNNLKKEGAYYYLDLTLSVGSGTYIRSIAEEIGKRLGYPATTAHLKRTSIGEYFLEDAQSI
ncbi:tRNA pseudouridine(55) synthase TruB [bacterium]|nr:tRNA pseudouridine(55) synthase TruB [bacterium]|tara:strand:- start:3171 stop:3809 length:639 start_codon:yes stop_codon:yes gene_type:complete